MKTGPRDQTRARGFTLVEVLIVLAVIAVVTAIGIPNLLNAVHRGKQTRTMSDLRAIGSAVERYAVENGFYPRATTISSLSDQVATAYIRQIPLTDAWGNGFSVDSSTSRYTVASCGRGAAGACTPVCTGSCGPKRDFGDDIIFSAGAFVQWPEGPQQ